MCPCLTAGGTRKAKRHPITIYAYCLESCPLEPLTKGLLYTARCSGRTTLFQIHALNTSSAESSSDRAFLNRLVNYAAPPRQRRTFSVHASACIPHGPSCYGVGHSIHSHSYCPSSQSKLSRLARGTPTVLRGHKEDLQPPSRVCMMGPGLACVIAGSRDIVPRASGTITRCEADAATAAKPYLHESIVSTRVVRRHQAR